MTSKWVRLVGVPVAAASLVGLTACGASAAASGSTGSGAGASGADMTALQSCLAENGVTLPEGGPGGGGGTGGTPPTGAAAPTGTPSADGQGAPAAGQAPPGVDATNWAKAQAACAQYAPTGGSAPAA